MVGDMVLQVGKTSLFASALIILILALAPLLQRRYKARWRCFAWLIIALRFLIPVDLALPQAPIRIVLPEQRTVVMVTPPANERPNVQVDWGDAITTVENESDFPVNVNFPNTIAINPLTIVGGVWLAGMLGFLFFQIASYQVFLRKLNTARTRQAPQPVKEVVWRIGADMGICRLPETIITDTIDAPVLIGVLRPRILLPHAGYSNEEITFILRHELVHYRRRDMWYKLVLLLANAMHWFNPFVYLMTVQAAKDIELACDDDVTRDLDSEARARYGDAILAALPRKRRFDPMFSTHFGSTGRNMKDRLRNLFDMAVKRRGIAALFAVIVCAITLTSIVTVGYASAKTDTNTNRTDSLIRSFAAYKSFGVSYDAEQDAVYYNGERVKLFVEFMPEKEVGMTYAFKMCYQDSGEAGTLYLEAYRDDNGKLIGIRRLDNKIALELLEDMDAADSNTARPDGEPFGIVMDGTSVIKSHGITARDMKKDKADAQIIDWIGQCDKKQGAYLMKTKSGDVYTTYIYYNGGGRYPWNIGAEKDTITVNLYSGSGLATTDGYSLIYFTSETDYSDIHLYLDGLELKYATVDQIRYDADREFTTMTGSNNVTVKSIAAGEVKCIGKIELGPDIAYTATLSAESGSNAMIALHDSPNITRYAETGWSQHYGNAVGSSIYFSSQQPKSVYVYVGSQAVGGTGLVNVTARLVQVKFPVNTDGSRYFQISNDGGNRVTHSGSFEAKAGQTLTLSVKSSLKGGNVDFFLFPPAGNGVNKETRYTFGGSDTTKTVDLSAGIWAYNCTGFFDSGDIVITGTIGSAPSTNPQAAGTETKKYDAEGIRIMDNSGTWGDSINRLLPYMSPDGVDTVVSIYLERHLFPISRLQKGPGGLPPPLNRLFNT